MRKEREFDVLVAGAGVTGLAAAGHLLALGVRRVAVASAELSSSAAAAGVVSGGQVDNFTRVSHAHGARLGAALWRFGDAAFDALMAFCKRAGVPHATQRRLRLITSEPELTEATRAVAELQTAGFPGVQLAERSTHPLGAALLSRVLAVQDDGPRGGWVDVAALLEKLAEPARPAVRLPAVQSLTGKRDGIAIELVGAEPVRAQMVIVAAHLGTRQLVPELHDALVSFADQWSELELDGDAGADLTGVQFTANHTYEWGAFRTPRRLVLGGGRYLRPLAGIEATTARVEAKITAHLLGQLAKTFAGGAAPRTVATTAGLDIRPCDELPVIGPMFGDGRILVAAGFMGSGLTQGFLAGRCLAELVQKGDAPMLPRGLWPERLRSLES